MKPNYHQPLMPDGIYHMFSRANGSEKLFKSTENYNYFLRRMNDHIHRVVDVYAYTLMPNHFHLLIKVKPKPEIVEHYYTVKKKQIEEDAINIPDFVMERFSNLLNGYTKAFNEMYSRKGSLFMDYIRRNKAEDDDALRSFLNYIHSNAVHHGYQPKIGEWKYDSYRSFLSPIVSETNAEVLKWFGGVDRFIEFHSTPVQEVAAPFFTYSH